jgi:hypothetical protein
MSVAFGVLVIAGCGALGGIANAMLSSDGVVLPARATDGQGHTVAIRPGFVGNVLLGALAAVVSWCLYGPASGLRLMGSGPDGESTWTLTLSALAGAVLVGIGGARWISSEVDKKLLRVAGARAAESSADRDLARMFASAPPMSVLRAATKPRE